MTSGKDAAGPPPQPDDEVTGELPPVPAQLEPPVVSKEDYAHTTSGTPDHTALIPAIKDELPPTPPPIVDTAPPKVESLLPREEPAPTPAAPARRRLVRVEPYSITRLAFVVSVALMIVSVVAVAIFWIMLAVTGVWGQINDSVASLLSDDSSSFDIKDYLGFGRMVGATLVLSGINVILMTGLATVGAHLYNLAAALLGGVETTFTDD
ncbi:MAG: DUF3566 domain-containing protein [Aeromicrobium sp.]